MPDTALSEFFEHKRHSPTCYRTRPLIAGYILDPFENWIARHESGLNPFKHNPKSTAFGIGQLLKATRHAIASQLGFDENTTDVAQQIQMMKTYIQQRFTPGSVYNRTGLPPSEAAYNWWQSHGWY